MFNSVAIPKLTGGSRLRFLKPTSDESASPARPDSTGIPNPTRSPISPAPIGLVALACLMALVWLVALVGVVALADLAAG
jgi:hypothetical protein